MLINVRNRDGKLRSKDILDIALDMSVYYDENADCYKVRISKSFDLDDVFESEEDAEAALKNISNARNSIESELRMYS